MNIIEKGNRRLFVTESGLVALLMTAVCALIRPDTAGTLALVAGGIVTITSLYLGGDAYVKGKNGNTLTPSGEASK